jgi:hypothetical protein
MDDDSKTNLIEIFGRLDAQYITTKIASDTESSSGEWKETASLVRIRP